MINGILGVLGFMFFVIAGLCLIEVVGRICDRFTRTRWERQGPRRVLKQIRG